MGPIDHIFKVTEKIGIYKKLYRPGPPGRKDLGKYCAFHDSNGHDIADCQHLKDQIEDLIKNGYLSEWVLQEAKRYKDNKVNRDAGQVDTTQHVRAGNIRTIFGGPYIGGASRSARDRFVREAKRRPLMNVCILSQRPPKLFKGENMDITIGAEDGKWAHLPHNDALVITATIGAINVHQVLVDNGSFVDVLSYETYQKMGFIDKDMTPTSNGLYGFTGNLDHIMGKIKVLMTLGEEPCSVTQMTEFMMVNEDISYNVIMGRPSLMEMRAVASIYYLVMRFPTLNGIGCVRGCQYEYRECYYKAIQAAKKLSRSQVDMKIDNKEPTKVIGLYKAIVVVELPNEEPMDEIPVFPGIAPPPVVLMLEALPTELIEEVQKKVHNGNQNSENKEKVPNVSTVEIEIDPRIPETVEKNVQLKILSLYW